MEDAVQTLCVSCLGAWELVALLAPNSQREAPSLLIPLHVDTLLLLTKQNERRVLVLAEGF